MSWFGDHKKELLGGAALIGGYFGGKGDDGSWKLSNLGENTGVYGKNSWTGLGDGITGLQSNTSILGKKGSNPFSLTGSFSDNLKLGAAIAQPMADVYKVNASKDLAETARNDMLAESMKLDERYAMAEKKRKDQGAYMHKGLGSSGFMVG